MPPIFTALSALQTESKRLAVSADNVANAGSLGFVETIDGGNNGGYQPRRVQSVTLPGGGVSGREVLIDPSAVKVYQPGNPSADGEGLVPLPNVDLSEEFVTQILAKRAYEASARLIREEDKRLDVLLEILD